MSTDPFRLNIRFGNWVDTDELVAALRQRLSSDSYGNLPRVEVRPRTLTPLHERRHMTTFEWIVAICLIVIAAVTLLGARR